MDLNKVNSSKTNLRQVVVDAYSAVMRDLLETDYGFMRYYISLGWLVFINEPLALPSLIVYRRDIMVVQHENISGCYSAALSLGT